ncbi:MAG: 50S ribosomal protein L15 [Hyphomicrobiaceae bacterium]
MRLNDIKDKAGASKSRVRIGRGIGSGVGKTGGRGGKGQTARSGVAIGGFEGGQMPLYRRLPKRGFTSRNRRDMNEVNVGTLQAAVDTGRLDAAKTVDVTALVEAGILRRPLDGVRVLGEGELTVKLSLKVDHATATARKAIEGAGGSIELIERKVLAADEEKRAKSAAKKAKTVKKKGGEEE